MKAWAEAGHPLIRDDGTPGTIVMAGHYDAEDDQSIDVRYDDARLFGPGAPVRILSTAARVTSLRTEVTYLDDGFRLVRGAYGSLYILERLDPSPMVWSRDS